MTKRGTKNSNYGDIVIGWMRACDVREKEAARFLNLSMADFEKLLNGKLEVGDELARLLVGMKKTQDEE